MKRNVFILGTIFAVVVSLSFWWIKAQEVEELQKNVNHQKKLVMQQQSIIQKVEQKNADLKKERQEVGTSGSDRDIKIQSLLVKNSEALQAYFNYSSLEVRDKLVHNYLTADFQKESQKAEENYDYEQGGISSQLKDSETYVNQQGNVFKTYNDILMQVTSQGEEQELHVAVTFTWKNESGNWLVSNAHFHTVEE
ncbi:hypothetical protein [Listeria goaensis]|uniref:hypothetical protein n=1 Tax=Listeria goaensis TaxID=1649188 RepID=UPI000B5900D1|nr:hypothetical protein [Listeria goaensis]